MQDIVNILHVFSDRLHGLRKYKKQIEGDEELAEIIQTELRLTERQKDKVHRSLGICRFLANQYIARNIWLYRLYQRGVLDENRLALPLTEEETAADTKKDSKN